MDEIDGLKRKLAARLNVPGYESNVRALQARIDELTSVTTNNSLGDAQPKES